MLSGDRADQLHDDHGLAGTGAAKDARLTAFRKGSDQIDHFDAGFEDLHARGLLRKRRRRTMDRVARGRVDGSLFVNGFAQHVENTS